MAVVGSDAACPSGGPETDATSVEVTGSATSPLPEEARRLIAELTRSQQRLIEEATALMLARDLVDLLDRRADSAVEEAVRLCHDEEAIDHAVSSVVAADEARENETRVLERWMHHLDGVDELVAVARRLT